MIRRVKTAFMRNRVAVVYALLGLSIFLVGVCAFITYYYSIEVNQARQVAIQRYSTIESSIQLLSDLKDMETGQRGYIITADSDFLEPYHSGKENVKAQLATLGKLIGSTDRQTDLVKKKIITVIKNKSDELEKSIHITNTFGKDSAQKYVGTKVGKAQMDSLRGFVHELSQMERAQLLHMKQVVDHNEKMNDTIRFIAFVLIGLTSLAALLALIQKQQNINELVEGLRKSNEELEEKVADRTKQLTEANQAKDHFLGMATHDLKSPIANVLGLIELMRLENKDRPNSDLEYLGYMKDSCTGMQRLISNLLDLNRIEHGVSTIKMREVALSKLITKVGRDFLAHAQKKNIALLVDSSDDVIQTDPDALSRILENLVSNAIKFSPHGKRVQLKASRQHENILFEVADQGPGISAEDMPKLFGKFQKLSNKPTGGEGSTGLGLSITKEITILLGGEISVKSRVGIGTTFTVAIPRLIK
jgi:signal transduction histidine kinase